MPPAGDSSSTGVGGDQLIDTIPFGQPLLFDICSKFELARLREQASRRCNLLIGPFRAVCKTEAAYAARRLKLCELTSETGLGAVTLAARSLLAVSASDAPATSDSTGANTATAATSSEFTELQTHQALPASRLLCTEEQKGGYRVILTLVCPPLALGAISTCQEIQAKAAQDLARCL